MRVRRGLGGNGRGHTERLAAGPDPGVLVGRGEVSSGVRVLFLVSLVFQRGCCLVGLLGFVSPYMRSPSPPPRFLVLPKLFRGVVVLRRSTSCSTQRAACAGRRV